MQFIELKHSSRYQYVSVVMEIQRHLAEIGIDEVTFSK
jgi:hypothetical protein